MVLGYQDPKVSRVKVVLGSQKCIGIPKKGLVSQKIYWDLIKCFGISKNVLGSQKMVDIVEIVDNVGIVDNVEIVDIVDTVDIIDYILILLKQSETIPSSRAWNCFKIKHSESYL